MLEQKVDFTQKVNLTQYEHNALSRVYNLADGHAHQQQSFSQRNIIDRLPSIFYRVEASSQYIIEKDFLDSFFELAQQPKAIKNGSSLFCYSASIAIEMAAHLLRQRGLRTALIEPIFDNVPSLLKRSGGDLVAIDESAIFPEPKIDLLNSLDVDAFFIVMPNNPTGSTLSKLEFKKLVDFCAVTGKMLVVDFCFRFFDKSMLWDQYEVAINAGIDFLFIEDTGKTWPSLDMKASLVTVNSGSFEEIFRIHNDLLLNVSPFTLELLKQYINNSQEQGIDNAVINIVKSNREYLRRKLNATILRPASLNSKTSVEWLEILNGFSAEELWMTLSNKGIYILPGTRFYWYNTSHGTKYIRVALMRNHDLFKKAVDALVEALPPSV
jgi:aspartate/methionine/tyrosine aminotransferase